MNTNIENIAAAATYWVNQSTSGEGETFVVTTQTARAVLACNMGVMLAGVDDPRKFLTWQEANDEAGKLNARPQDFDGAELFYISTYHAFCTRMATRYLLAAETVAMADMLARRRERA